MTLTGPVPTSVLERLRDATNGDVVNVPAEICEALALELLQRRDADVHGDTLPTPDPEIVPMPTPPAPVPMPEPVPPRLKGRIGRIHRKNERQIHALACGLGYLVDDVQSGSTPHTTEDRLARLERLAAHYFAA